MPTIGDSERSARFDGSSASVVELGETSRRCRRDTSSCSSAIEHTLSAQGRDLADHVHALRPLLRVLDRRGEPRPGVEARCACDALGGDAQPADVQHLEASRICPGSGLRISRRFSWLEMYRRRAMAAQRVDVAGPVSSRTVSVQATPPPGSATMAPVATASSVNR